MTKRNTNADDGEGWDGATWVDVDRYGHWEPTPAERTRAVVLLGLLLGVLLLAAGFASIGAGGGGQAGTTSTTVPPTTEGTTTSVTSLPAASSIDGAEPPEGCETDDREGLALRDHDVVPVVVLNGVGIGGLAGTVSDQLQGVGIPAAPSDSPDPAAVTTFTYVAGYCAEAVRIAEVLDVAGAPLASVDGSLGGGAGDALVEVVLGSDHFGG